MKTNQNEQAQAIYSELALIQESATITCILAETQMETERLESFIVKRGQRGVGNHQF